MSLNANGFEVDALTAKTLNVGNLVAAGTAQ